MCLTIYVDDIIIACANLDYVKEVKQNSTFMTDMGELELNNFPYRSLIIIGAALYLFINNTRADIS